MIIDSSFNHVVGQIISQMVLANGKIRSVSHFFSPKERIKVCAKKYKFKRKPSVKDLIVTIGKPNYRERILIKRSVVRYPFVHMESWHV
jgi:hypothetical protein